MAKMWEALADLTGMLRRGEVDLDDLVAEMEKRKSQEAARKRVDEINHEIPNPVAEKKPTKLVIKFNKGEEAMNPQPTCIINYTKKRSRVDEETNKRVDEETNKRSRVMVQEQGGKTELFLTQEIKKLILDFGGREESVAFVIEKELYKSDVDHIQTRFFIPYGKVNRQFLDKLLPTEVALLKTGIPVTLFGFGGKEHALCLKEWKSNDSYVLVGGWYDICRHYGLEQHQFVQLWFFRRNHSDLSFAIRRATKKQSRSN